MSKPKLKPNADCRTVIERAVATGEWSPDGLDGQGHGILRHTTGATVAYAVGSSRYIDRNSVRNLAKDIENISGHVVWARSSRKPSRKACRGSGYTPALTLVDRDFSASVAALYNRLDVVDRAFAATDPRTDHDAAHRLAAERLDIEARLTALYQPVPTLEVPER